MKAAVHCDMKSLQQKKQTSYRESKYNLFGAQSYLGYIHLHVLIYLHNTPERVTGYQSDK